MDGARRIASNIAKLPTFLANIEHFVNEVAEGFPWSMRSGSRSS